MSQQNRFQDNSSGIITDTKYKKYWLPKDSWGDLGQWRTFEDADGKHTVTFGSPDEHPMGREILIHGDGMKSKYRVKDNRIRQISRTTPRMSFTINIEDTMTTDDGKFLTTQYVVFYFSGEGKLTDTDSFTETPCAFEGNYLPGTRRVISTENGKAIVRILEFKDHKLLS